MSLSELIVVFLVDFLLQTPAELVAFEEIDSGQFYLKDMIINLLKNKKLQQNSIWGRR